ncbi:unnamed protein product [Peniophora sp. CBMAI 1063]|nr:unnamed protein product [Peniophora sp. CBMAI 1063]
MSAAEKPPLACKALDFDTPLRPWPVNLGRKGPTWFLVFTRPRGMRMMREALPLNTLPPSDPFPADSPEGHPRFALFSPLEPKLLSALLDARVTRTDGDAPMPIVRRTGRTFGSRGAESIVEMEVLLSETEILHCCTHCFKWETMNSPAFLRCSGCKARFYCSQRCQAADWKKNKHKAACPLLRERRLLDAERCERMHQDQMQWQQSKMLRMDDSDHPMEREFDEDLDRGNADLFIHGARERYF